MVNKFVFEDAVKRRCKEGFVLPRREFQEVIRDDPDAATHSSLEKMLREDVARSSERVTLRPNTAMSYFSLSALSSGCDGLAGLILLWTPCSEL